MGIFNNIFICVAAPGLSRKMWDQVPCLGIEPGAPALGARSLSHWTTREVHYGYFYVFSRLVKGFPGGASGKEPTCQCRRGKRYGFDPWVGKIPWRRKGHPIPVFFPGKSHGQRNLVGYCPQGRNDSDTREATWQACTHGSATCLNPGEVASIGEVLCVPSRHPSCVLQGFRQRAAWALLFLQTDCVGNPVGSVGPSPAGCQALPYGDVADCWFRGLVTRQLATET